MIQNKGVAPLKLEAPDYVAGQETGIVYEEVNPTGNWTDSLPVKETQYINSFDTSACVTFSALNCIEIQLNYLLNAGKLSEDKVKKLMVWGYLENGKFNFSDRYTAKLSGTTPLGNTLQKVWDSIRKDGLVPEAMWKSEGNKNWAEYYREIPQQIKDFGKNILTIFDFKYEWLVTGVCGAPDLNYLKYHLKQAPLQPAHPLCVRDFQNVFQPCGSCATQHATTIFYTDELIRDFDHYYPYLNNYALTYSFPWIMKGVVTIKKDEPIAPIFNHTFTKDIVIGEVSEEVLWLQKGLNVLGYSIPLTAKQTDGSEKKGTYGNKTRLAVKDFQTKYGVASLPVLVWNNGRFVYGQTRAKLNELLTK